MLFLYEWTDNSEDDLNASASGTNEWIAVYGLRVWYLALVAKALT